MKILKKIIKIVLLLKVLFFIVAYFTNKLIFLTSTLKEVLFIQNKLNYNWRFGKIFYTKQGSGSPLLLVHDLNYISSAFEWNFLINDLSKNHTVYTIDLIGCGRSSKPNLVYTNFLYVSLISDFIKDIIKQKTHIAATGSASSALVMLCNNNSSLVNKIILINPDNLANLKKFPQPKHKLLKFIPMIPIVGTFIYNIASSKCYIKYILETKYFYNPNNIRKKVINAYYEAAHLQASSSKYLFSSIINHFTKIDITHALKKINNEILIIQGKFSPSAKEIVKQYLEHNNSIKVDIIGESKYLPQLERPKEVIDSIEHFLKK